MKKLLNLLYDNFGTIAVVALLAIAALVAYIDTRNDERAAAIEEAAKTPVTYEYTVTIIEGGKRTSSTLRQFPPVCASISDGGVACISTGGAGITLYGSPMVDFSVMGNTVSITCSRNPTPQEVRLNDADLANYRAAEKIYLDEILPLAQETEYAQLTCANPGK